MDPMHGDPPPQQRFRELIQRPVALNVAQENGGLGEEWRGGETCLDMVPVLVNVAYENDGHAVPVAGGSVYHEATVTLRKPPLIRMTVAEFLRWEPDDSSVRSWQLIDGEPVAMAPGSQTHAAIQIELGALLRNHLLASGSPCRTVTEAGIVPRLRANQNYRIPDLAVTCAPPSPDHVLPDPVLVIEILSPSNEVETWSNVWTYATIPSVTEIVVVHSTRVAAELLRREPVGQWPDEPTAIGPDDSIVLTSVDFRTALLSIYRTTYLAPR